MSRLRVAYVAASGLTLGAATWAAWWLIAGRLTAALLPIAVVGVGAEVIRRTAPGSTSDGRPTRRAEKRAPIEPGA